MTPQNFQTGEVGPAASDALARVPLVSSETPPAAVAGLFDEMRAGGKQPSNMHRAVANAPEAAAAYFRLAWALRNDDHVSRPLKELAILRTLQLVEGAFEFHQHTRMALACGVTEAQIAALPEWSNSGLFTPEQRAVLGWVEGMATKPGPDSASTEAMKAHFDPHAIVTITLTSAFYRMSALTTKALAVKLGEPPGHRSSVDRQDRAQAALQTIACSRKD